MKACITITPAVVFIAGSMRARQQYTDVFLFDTWYALEPLLTAIERLGKAYVTRLRSNHVVNLDDERFSLRTLAASISTPGGNFWVTYYPAPFFRARGDGTYLLYLAAPLAGAGVGSGKLSAVMAVTLAPGSRDSACLCQPDCTGKACGAPDGCGGYCQPFLYGGGRGSWTSAVKGWEDWGVINSLCGLGQWCQVTTLGQPPVCAPKPI